MPLDPQLTISVEQGKSLVQHFPDSVSAKIFKGIADTLDQNLQHRDTMEVE